MSRNSDGSELEGGTGDTGSDGGSTLLPMLLGGLVLIVVGAVIVMAFV